LLGSRRSPQLTASPAAQHHRRPLRRSEMRHGRLTAIAAAALLAMAIAPAWAAADPSPLTDDTLTDFAAGTPGSDTWAIEPGMGALKPSFNDNSAGTSLDSSNWSTATGTPTVGLGALTLDGAEIDATQSGNAPQTLQFRATFGGDHGQH